jgi:hypothetical protein
MSCIYLVSFEDICKSHHIFLFQYVIQFPRLSDVNCQIGRLLFHLFYLAEGHVHGFNWRYMEVLSYFSSNTIRFSHPLSAHCQVQVQREQPNEWRPVDSFPYRGWSWPQVVRLTASEAERVIERDCPDVCCEVVSVDQLLTLRGESWL